MIKKIKRKKAKKAKKFKKTVFQIFIILFLLIILAHRLYVFRKGRSNPPIQKNTKQAAERIIPSPACDLDIRIFTGLIEKIQANKLSVKIVYPKSLLDLNGGLYKNVEISSSTKLYSLLPKDSGQKQQTDASGEQPNYDGQDLRLFNVEKGKLADLRVNGLINIASDRSVCGVGDIKAVGLYMISSKIVIDSLK